MLSLIAAGYGYLCFSEDISPSHLFSHFQRAYRATKVVRN
jgi:hypothetical protein